MRRTGHRIACVLAAAVLMLPAAAWGQSAGDEQYEDPFAPEQGQTDDEGSAGGGDTGSAGGDTGSAGGGDTGSAGGGETVQPAPTAAPEAAPPAPATTTSAGEQLPRTGGDTGLLALGGAVLLAGGVALRVTLRRR